MDHIDTRRADKPAKKGDLDFGTVGSSAVLAGVLVLLVLITSLRPSRD